MKVTRTSGMPLEPEDIPKYQAELEAGLEALTKELGRFEKLSQTDQGTFVRRFQEMREAVQKKYKFEDVWDYDQILSSKSKIKQLVNCYGTIAFSRGDQDKKLRCFIIDN